MGRRLGRLVAAGVAGVVARRVLAAVRGGPYAGQLERVNFRGRTVTLAAGPAVAAGAVAGAALAAPGVAAAAAVLTAGASCAAVGLYDDMVGARPEQKAAKGFAGHLGALRAGRVTSGLVKIVGVGAAGLAAAALLEADPAVHGRRRNSGRLAGALDVLLGAGVIAGSANLLNLLDLRPGRALKAGLLIGLPLAGGRSGGLTAGPLGASLAVLPADLRERVMLGDAGANALGAVLGVAVAARCGPVGRAGVFAVLAALTAASEKVSFSQVIDRTPALRRLDALGRRRS